MKTTAAKLTIDIMVTADELRALRRYRDAGMVYFHPNRIPPHLLDEDPTKDIMRLTLTAKELSLLAEYVAAGTALFPEYHPVMTNLNEALRTLGLPEQPALTILNPRGGDE